jgi:hypothetical protein
MCRIMDIELPNKTSLEHRNAPIAPLTLTGTEQ